MSYWEHTYDLSMNLEWHPSWPYFLKNFNEFGASSIFDNEKTSMCVCISHKINVKGSKEGQILKWNALGFDILKAIDIQLPNAPNVY
jgi:hypothetical protein